MSTNQYLLFSSFSEFCCVLFYLFNIPFSARYSNPCLCIWVALEDGGRVDMRGELNGAKSSNEFGNDSKYGRGVLHLWDTESEIKFERKTEEDDWTGESVMSNVFNFAFFVRKLQFVRTGCRAEIWV